MAASDAELLELGRAVHALLKVRVDDYPWGIFVELFDHKRVLALSLPGSPGGPGRVEVKFPDQVF